MKEVFPLQGCLAENGKAALLFAPVPEG